MANWAPLVNQASPQNLPAGDVILVNVGSAAAPALAFSGDTNTGIYNPAADEIDIVAGGTRAIKVTPTDVRIDGIVGVGGPSNSQGIFTIGQGNPLTGTAQNACFVFLIANTNCTLRATGFQVSILLDNNVHTQMSQSLFLGTTALNPGATCDRTFQILGYENSVGSLANVVYWTGVFNDEDEVNGNWLCFFDTTTPSYYKGNICLSSRPTSATQKFGTGATHTISIEDGTAPSTSPTSVAQLYSQSGRLNSRTASGEIERMASVALRRGGRKNIVTNGKFLIAQRYASKTVGVAISPSTGGEFGLDRWKYNWNVASGTYQISQTGTGSPVPGDSLGFGVFRSSAGYGLDANSYAYIEQPIEGTDWAMVYGKEITVSFWMKAPATGVYGVALVANEPTIRQCVKSVTINAANTWEFKTVTFPVDGSSSSPTLVAGAVGGWLRIFAHAGSSKQTATTTWQSASGVLGPTGHADPFANTNSFVVANVQMEQGSEATDYEGIGFDQELARCQRYYTKSYPVATAPGATNDSGSVVAYPANTTRWGTSVRFPVGMRTSPTITLYNPNSGATGSWRDSTAGANLNGSAKNISDGGAHLYGTVAGTVGNESNVHYTADAEF